MNMRLRLRLMDAAVSVTDSVAKFKALQQDEGSALYTSTTQLKWLDAKYAPVIELPPAGASCTIAVYTQPRDAVFGR